MKILSEQQRMRGGKNVRLQEKSEGRRAISRKESEKLAREIWEEMNGDLIINTDFMQF